MAANRVFEVAGAAWGAHSEAGSQRTDGLFMSDRIQLTTWSLALGLAGIWVVAMALPQQMELSIRSLHCEYLLNPLGIDQRAPRLSWRVESPHRGQKQTAYRVLVASSREALEADRADLWDSGKVESSKTVQVVYRGKPLASRQACYWKVRVWDKDGKPSSWSEPGRWSMGLQAPSDWQAEWISHRDETPLHTSREALYLPAARYYRKPLQVGKAVRRASVYATALGIYELHVNGKRVGDTMFTPGWSDYRQRVYYNTYDVTALLRGGENVIGAIVAEGWYSGYVGYGLLVGYGPNKAGRYFYGKTPALRVQMEIEYADGSRQVLASDPSWKVATGPIVEADIIMGETYDARREQDGWDRPGFDDSAWQPAIPARDNPSVKAPFFDKAGEREVELGFVEPARLQSYPSVPIRAIEEIKPVRMSEPESGVYIFDMGQNFSGVVRLRVRGPEGVRVQLRFAEMLHSDGRLMTENLRRARATDAYILRGDPNGETWMPRFTYHGFQYVELTGYPGKPDLDAVTGIVVHSDTPLTSSFTCSDPMINQLHRNIVWTQRSNFFEVPTDCPQRDERLGWTGDAQAYIRAASYNADVGAFFTKWLDDLVESQRPSGAYPDYAPYPMQHGDSGQPFATAWTDAGVICPYTMYKVYDDRRVIERHYESMNRFMDFRRRNSPDFRGVAIGNGWGDWLAMGEQTPVAYIDAVYFAFTARLMSEMAAAIGKPQDAAEYQRLFEKIQAAFVEDYLEAGGRIKVDTQTAYSLALFVGLLPEDVRQQAADRLAQKIRENDGRMATGFLGTRPLLPVLSANGHHDLAAELLQSRKFPSWGYEVENGATTIWERWNSYTKDEGFHNPSMNSFSHYAFGAVSEWMFQTLAGIDTEGTGFEKILIRPRPPAPGSNPDREAIHWVNASYDSVHGKIVSHWKREPERFSLEVTIPANTSATVEIPAGGAEGVSEGGRSLDAAEGVRFLRMEGDRAVVAVESGSYRFESKLRR